MISDTNVKKITMYSVKISLLQELKSAGPVGQGQKKTFSSNFERYNLSIRAVKVSEIFSTYSHSSLVQICTVEF